MNNTALSTLCWSAFRAGSLTRIAVVPAGARPLFVAGFRSSASADRFAARWTARVRPRSPFLYVVAVPLPGIPAYTVMTPIHHNVSAYCRLVRALQRCSPARLRALGITVTGIAD